MYQLTINAEQLALLLRVLGNEKTRCYQQGNFPTAHNLSDLLALAKNAKEVSKAS
jgi:hypothetical protein